MAWVPAVCPQCAGKIEVDNTKERGVCSFCGTEFNAEKAINNYNYNYDIQNDYHFANAEVHIFDEKSTENKLKNAEVFFLKHKDFGKARKLFLEVTNESPDDYRGWWGVARVDSNEFTNIHCGAGDFSKIESYVNCAFNVVSSDKKVKLSKIWEKFKNERKVFLEECEKNRNSYLNSRDSYLNGKNNSYAIIDDLNKQLDEICKTRENLIQAKKSAENKIYGILSVEGIAVLSVMTILFLIFARIIGCVFLCLFLILIFFAVKERVDIKDFDVKISQLEAAEVDIKNQITNEKSKISDIDEKISDINRKINGIDSSLE